MAVVVLCRQYYALISKCLEGSWPKTQARRPWWLTSAWYLARWAIESVRTLLCALYIMTG